VGQLGGREATFVLGAVVLEGKSKRKKSFLRKGKIRKKMVATIPIVMLAKLDKKKQGERNLTEWHESLRAVPGAVRLPLEQKLQSLIKPLPFLRPGS